MCLRSVARTRRIREDLAPAREEQLVRVVDEPQLGVRQAALEVACDRRRADAVALAPPQRHRRAHLVQLEAPGAAEVGELARKPETAVAERLDAAACVGLVRDRVA